MCGCILESPGTKPVPWIFFFRWTSLPGQGQGCGYCMMQSRGHRLLNRQRRAARSCSRGAAGWRRRALSWAEDLVPGPGPPFTSGGSWAFSKPVTSSAEGWIVAAHLLPPLPTVIKCAGSSQGIKGTSSSSSPTPLWGV